MEYWSVLEYELYYKKRDNAEIEAELSTISCACPCLFAEKRKKFGQWERTARQFSCHAVPDKNALLSAQLRAQLGFEQRKDALHILVGLLAGEAAVVRAQRQAERNGLAARLSAHTTAMSRVTAGNFGSGW